MAGQPTALNVLWLAKGLGLGGLEQLLVTHARLGDRERFSFSAAYLVDRPHSVVDELEALSVPTHRLGTGSGRDQRWIAELVELTNRERIDVVHIHSPAPAALARPAVRAVRRHCGIVYTEHNRWDRFEPATRWANRLTYSLNHASFAVSDDCRSSMSPRAQRRTETLIHGVPIADVEAAADRDGVRAELGIGPDQIVIGIVANFRKQKNYQLLLDAAAELVPLDDRLIFLSVGQGPLEDELVAHHSRLGLGDRFRFLGVRRDAQRVMSGFDVFCLSSVHEGLPVAVMEAKALGLPIVATSVGGVPTAVTDGVDGVLVPSGDRAALVGALRDIATDAGLRARIGAASRETAARFDATVAIERLQRAYVEVAALTSR